MKSVLLAWLLVLGTPVLASHPAHKLSKGFGGNAVHTQHAVAMPMPVLASSGAQGANLSVQPDTSNSRSKLFGGLLLGFGIGALLSDWGPHQAWINNAGTLVLLLIVLFAISKLWHWLRGTPAPRYEWETYVPEINARIESAGLQLPMGLDAQAPDTPPGSAGEQIQGFDAEMFVNHAKNRFVCLQVAWDKDDFTSIRSLTTPALFAALRQQSQKPGRIARHTDVVQLFCTLLGVRPLGQEYVASVHFEGLMKPLPDASAEPFSEIWHITRPLAGRQGWALAGIQKIS